MRSAIVLLLLGACVAVLAGKDDVACVVHSDDCGRCVSNGCSWCSDGFCVSETSDVCEAHKIATECSVPSIVHPSGERKRQGPTQTPAPVVCESITTCAACATAACSICRDPVTKTIKCSSDSTCQASLYNAAFEWWVQESLPTAQFSVVPSCPAPKEAAPDSPTLEIVFKVFVVLPGGGVPDAVFQAAIANFLAAYFGPGVVTADNVIVVNVTITPAVKRQQLDTTERDATVLLKFADSPDFTAQGLAATLNAYYTDSPVQLAPGSQPITAKPYTPTAGTGAVVTRGNSNSNLELSKGALAGIIIGCIIAGALIVALIAFLVLRRGDNYPQAFRSPAAAYRP